MIHQLAQYAQDNNTIAICNRTIQLIAAIVDETGIEHEPYDEGVCIVQEAVGKVAGALTGNLGYGYLTEETNKALQFINQLS